MLVYVCIFWTDLKSLLDILEKKKVKRSNSPQIFLKQLCSETV